MPESRQHPEQQPHWAVQLFLDPKQEFSNNLQPGKDYPEVDYHRALQSFDPESQGWVPLWFPRQVEGEKLNPQERYAWFDKALEHYAQEAWPPQGSLNSRKRAVALSLLHMLYEQELQGIPTPDKL
jgi:hypothetical protein